MPTDRIIAAALLIIPFLTGGCATSPPTNPDDLCDIFQEKRGWYQAAKRAHQRWQTPIELQMAIIYQESRFQATAKPPRKRFLGLIPTFRPSSAYGYAQATDHTWKGYQRETGRFFADRDNFADAVDFIGWYVATSRRKLGLSFRDFRNHYLAYHEGHTGFTRRSYRRKAWLQTVATRVDHRATRYRHQLQHCRNRLERRGGWPF